MATGLDQFMAAIRQLESGGNYEAIGPYTGSTYGRARGAYQVMETIWPAWAKEAGIPGADWRNPDAQDRVARYKMRQYFERFGRWDLVAVAWFAGPGRAEQAARQGIQSVGELSDVIGTSVTQYVQKAMDLMGQQPQSRPISGSQAIEAGVDPAAAPGAPANPSTDMGLAQQEQQPDPAQQFVEGRRTQSETFARIMSSISEAASQRGGQELNIEALFGGVFANDEEEAEDAATA